MEVKKRLTMPHTLVLIFLIILAVGILTYVIPAGEFERVTDEASGQTLIVPGSFQFIDSSAVGFFSLMQSIYNGMVEGGGIIFFIFFAYAYIFMIIKSGAMNSAIKVLLRIMHGREYFSIIVLMPVFALISASSGLYDEMFGLIPIVVGIAIALGYDAIVGMAIICLSMGIGYAGSFMNPFTVGVAQSISELPLFSGAWFRLISLGVFVIIGILWTLRYAKKIKKNPEYSYVKDLDFGALTLKKEEIENAVFTGRQKLVLLGFVASFGAIMFGALKYGWFLSEICGIFFIAIIVTAIIMGWGPNKIANMFVESAAEIVFAAMIVGFARGVLVVLDSGHITDTIVFYLSEPLKELPLYVSTWFMTIIQSVLNFFIPSGSGQAMVTMPIMSSVSDVIGLQRQVAVLAFQYGDAFTNLLWPASSIAVLCGLAKVPLNKWWKFYLPVFGILMITSFALITIAVVIGYA